MTDEKKQSAVGETVPAAGEKASGVAPAEAEGLKPEAKATSESKAVAERSEEVATPKEPQAVAKEEEGKEKPTRAERRIRQLIDKLKEAKTQAEAPSGDEQVSPKPDTVSEIIGVTGQAPWQQSSVLQPGAEVSLDELQAELNRRAAAIAEIKARQTVEQYRRQERLRQSLDEFSGELEKLSREVPELNPDSPEYDKNLDQKFAELVVEVNSDERGQFLPKKRPSEIFEALRTAMERAKTKGQAETTAKMAKSMAEAAVSPTASPKKRLSTEEEIAEALRKGEITAKEAEKLLPKTSYGY